MRAILQVLGLEWILGYSQKIYGRLADFSERNDLKRRFQVAT